MGNDGFGCDCGNCHGGFYGGYWGINRRGWKPVSDRAKRVLEEAKSKFHDFVKQCSFTNVADPEYKYTKKHAIDLHLVGKLRPEFNRYVKSVGAFAKWKALTPQQKALDKRYKHRKSAIYFGDLTIDRTVRQKLEQKEPNAFQREYLIAEISLFTFLTHRGVPEIEALGWIVEIPKSQKIEQIPKINDLSAYLDHTSSAMIQTIHIEQTEGFNGGVFDESKMISSNTSKRGSIKSSTTNSATRTLRSSTVSTRRTSSSTVTLNLPSQSPEGNVVKKSSVPTTGRRAKRRGFFATSRTSATLSTSNVGQSETAKTAPVSSESTVVSRKRKYPERSCTVDTKKKVKEVMDLCSSSEEDDDEKWNPRSVKRRKLR